MSYLDEMFSLKGKTAVITGGGGNIAYAMGEALLRAGANVSLWGHRYESIDANLAKLADATGLKDQLQRVKADTGDEAAVIAGYEETEKQFGSVDILINAAGGNKGKSDWEDVDMDVFEDVLRLNLLAGLMVPTKVFVKNWKAKEIKGSIINLTSMTSYIPLSGTHAYGAAKSAVLNLTYAGAREFAKDGIRVNAIAPGFFVGKQNKALLFDEATGNLTARGEAIIAHTPFGRFGDVQELGGALLFLCSDKASGFVTGVSIPVDGGYLVHNI